MIERRKNKQIFDFLFFRPTPFDLLFSDLLSLIHFINLNNVFKFSFLKRLSICFSNLTQIDLFLHWEKKCDFFMKSYNRKILMKLFLRNLFLKIKIGWKKNGKWTSGRMEKMPNVWKLFTSKFMSLVKYGWALFF